MFRVTNLQPRERLLTRSKLRVSLSENRSLGRLGVVHADICSSDVALGYLPVCEGVCDSGELDRAAKRRREGV